MQPSTRILLVGCGKMGGALLKGWLHNGISPSSVVVIEPHPAADIVELHKHQHLSILATLEELPDWFIPNIVVFAIKPQGMETVVPAYNRIASPGTLFLSIAAGKTIAFFEKHLGRHAIIRVMPNLPAIIAEAAMVSIANAHVTQDQHVLATQLLGANGQVIWIKDETHMDAVTAISGSGPAYIFHFIEALTEAGIALGLPQEFARQLACQTVYGSSDLAKQSEHSAATLREQVTSPKGTTAAALDVLMDDNTGLTQLMKKAAFAAFKRSQELA